MVWNITAINDGVTKLLASLILLLCGLLVGVGVTYLRLTYCLRTDFQVGLPLSVSFLFLILTPSLCYSHSHFFCCVALFLSLNNNVCIWLRCVLVVHVTISCVVRCDNMKICQQYIIVLYPTTDTPMFLWAVITARNQVHSCYQSCWINRCYQATKKHIKCVLIFVEVAKTSSKDTRPLSLTTFRIDDFVRNKGYVMCVKIEVGAGKVTCW